MFNMVFGTKFVNQVLEKILEKKLKSILDSGCSFDVQDLDISDMPDCSGIDDDHVFVTANVQASVPKSYIFELLEKGLK